MTDLGELLGSVEDHLEVAQRGSVPSAASIGALRDRVRRRRTLRHVRDGAVGGTATVVVAALAWWGLDDGGRTAPAPATTPTASAPTASAAPAPTSAPGAGERVVATPLPVPADALTSTDTGWLLASTTYYRDGLPDDAVFQDGDIRSTVDLVSPAGQRTPLLEPAPRTTLAVHAWRAGTTTAVASAAGPDEDVVSGLLDLRTGVLTPLDVPWDRQPLGLAVTGESLWVGNPPPPELGDPLPDGVSAVFPGARVGADPDEGSTGDGAEGAPPVAPPYTGRLQAFAADGTARDLGEATLPYRLRPLSPDAVWLVLQDAAGMVAVDVRDGTRHPLTRWPAGTGCRPGGWSGPHEVLVACEQGDGTWQLHGVDVARDAAPRALGRSDVPVREAWPLADGRVALGRVTVRPPCHTTGDPAVLEGGTVRSLTQDWSPYDHGTQLVVSGDAVWTHLNGCYPGSGRADHQRDVRVDVAGGVLTTLAWLEGRAPEQVVEDGWRVVLVEAFVPAR